MYEHIILEKNPTANVGGVFLVLGVGCFVALIVAIIEFLANVNKIAIEARVSVIVGSRVLEQL